MGYGKKNCGYYRFLDPYTRDSNGNEIRTKKVWESKSYEKKDMTSKVKFQRGFYGIQSTQFRT
jgi:hypothetical protein